MSKSKKLVYVPEELFDKVKRISKGMGESAGTFVEKAVKLALKAVELNYSPEKAVELLDVIQAQRALGGAFVPQDALNLMIENSQKSQKEQLQTRWYEGGKAHGKYLKEKFEDPVQALKALIELAWWGLSRVEAEQEEETVRLRCVSAALTAEATELLAKFMEGAMHGIGYNTERADYTKGIIIMEFHH